jgi:hypothetical protein
MKYLEKDVEAERTSKTSQRPSPTRVRVCLGLQDQREVKRMHRTLGIIFDEPHMHGKLTS